MVKHNNYWFSTWQSRQDITAGLPKHVDVAIIGGGLNGFALLYELVANTDMTVVLLESDSTAFHASGRGIGHVSELDIPTMAGLVDQLGVEITLAYAVAIRTNNQWLASLIQREDIDCSYAKPGGLHVSSEKDGLISMKAWPTINPGSHREFLDRKALAALLPSDKFTAGVFTPSEATLNPYSLVHGLRNTCNSLGRHVLDNANVRAVSQHSSGFKIYVHNRGSFTAKNVVHCTGAYCGGLIRAIKPGLSIWKTHTIASSIIPEKFLELVPEQTIVHVDRVCRIHKDRILLSGGVTPLKNAANDGQYEQPVFQRLVQWWRSVFPNMPKTISASKVWSHVNCTAKDGLPLIGPIPERPGEFINVGSDLNFTLVAAHMITDYITGSDTAKQPQAWAAFRPDRVISER